MAKLFPIYKGLQKPLIYKGFQGKFIGWGIGSLVSGVVLGGTIGSLTSMVFGGFITVSVIVGGLFFTSQQQKKGLHNKTRHEGIFQFAVDLKKARHVTKKKN
ncbi:hypothetical protein P872_06140 [Rhodonellum psychrophilum GCM71 = DSM 17998]|uniref:DUF4133 domain-containing protein n=2 Tax=Rhodonellum TaxID=336827 RepID=U5C2A0_9BACT|nr:MULTISPECIES: hypothetical protein [Rhodonellum]ERM83051.1 hypothetical protein P872_06140 [Rhodonellum psychrophilum GCM71 = DSM 17998]SDZ47346.1 hypothetical protein SAMN05444412_11643 [Rhodonellum ikkaensis]